MSTKPQSEPFVPLPSEAPPNLQTGLIGWLRVNLFSSWANSIATLLIGYTIVILGYPFAEWAFIHADWVGSTREDCSSGGACWVFVYVRLEQFIYGFYPEHLQWRVDIVFAMLAALLVALAWERVPYKKYTAIFSLVGFPIISYYLLLGGSFGLEAVDTHQWGGLMLTLVLALIGIVAALPIGIVLALGRRAEMPVIRSICTVFIEVWRGVPLITVLFMASVMLPLFMSHGSDSDKLMRALIGIIMFQSAYMAEVVRGGLQAIPKGQYEAAEALGLNYGKKMYLVILPQALKIMIPGIVNTFIALFKDTSLVLIIGLFDLLAIVQSALADPKWLGYSIEGYLFVALVFWVFCFGMSQYSQNLEKKLNTGHNN
jgi:general L-amino acid transport system permease protein